MPMTSSDFPGPTDCCIRMLKFAPIDLIFGAISPIFSLVSIRYAHATSAGALSPFFQYNV